MKLVRNSGIIILILLILVSYIQIGLAAEEVPFVIDADEYILFDEEGQIIEAKGNVNILFESDSIRADEVLIDLVEKKIYAKDNVLLQQEGQELLGDSLEYDYEKEEGKFYNGQTEQDKIKFRGEVLNLREGQMVMEETSLTPCIHDTPHYKLTAKTITIYPDEKVVAKGVYLWINDHKILPLPSYTTSLDEDSVVRKKNAIPKIDLGYSDRDGIYLETDYHHYINEDLEGDIFFKATSRRTNKFDLDYRYSPSEAFEFNPTLSYDQVFGLDTAFTLKNKLGDISSDLSYNRYIEDDQEEEDYKERKWMGNWDLKTKILGVNAHLNLYQDYLGEDIEEELTFKKEWSDYYWQIKGSQDKQVNYQPEFSLGVDNKDLGDGTLLSTDLSIGKIYEEGANGDVEAERQKFSLSLNDEEVSLGEDSSLYWSGKLTDSSYDTNDDYRSYDLNLGLKQKLGVFDLNFDYQYYNELGTTPFQFDALTESGIGERNYLSAGIGSDVSFSDDLDLDWKVSVGENSYQSGEEYQYYGFDGAVEYQINDVNAIALDYNYQNTLGKSPLEEDQLDLANEIRGSYRYQTNQQEFPYWDIGVEAGYDFNKEELSGLNYSVTKELDCFNVGVEYDQLEEDLNFGVEFKY